MNVITARVMSLLGLAPNPHIETGTLKVVFRATVAPPNLHAV